MKLTCNDTLYTYDAYHLLKAFYPDEEIEQQVDEEQESQIRIESDCDSCFCVTLAGEKTELLQMDRGEKKHLAVRSLYEKLCRATKKSLPWGSLTGVRPTKMLMQKLEEGVPDDRILDWITKEHFVSGEKAKLGLDIAKREKRLLSRLDYENGYSLYIGIPFCPTTCSYCSFTSYPISQYLEKTDAYLEALCKELSYIAAVSREKKLNTIYLGGGTPTSLRADQLDRLFTHLEKQFSYEHLLELTVEAGRPDSITREKLKVLKRHGIGRISVNPQTMQQKTLDLVGRRHTVEDVITTFRVARELGFDNINMDLIVGLPNENLEDVRHTMEQLEELQPDNVTVHSLAIKRAARLNMFKEDYINLKMENTWEHIEVTADYCKRMGLQPYYLYRQKNMAGNFENVGYAKEGKAGIYNILIMEEKQTIVACGAGASTKRVWTEPNPDGTHRIERCENVKDVALYIERIDEMIERKKRLFAEE